MARALASISVARSVSHQRRALQLRDREESNVRPAAVTTVIGLEFTQLSPKPFESREVNVDGVRSLNTIE